jgi:hypothetical protein
MVYIHNEVLFSDKKNKIMSFVAKWMSLKIIVVSKINQFSKDKCRMFSLICGIKMKRHGIKKGTVEDVEGEQEQGKRDKKVVEG